MTESESLSDGMGLRRIASLQILSTVLLWNFALTSQLEKLPSKMRRDFAPTLVNGKHTTFC